MEFFWITYHFFTKLHQRPFETSNNGTWIHGSRTGEGNDVFPGDYRVFLTGDRQTKCLHGDRQRTVCPTEGPSNLVAVRIRCLSVWNIQPHMYPRRSTSSDV